MTDQVVTAADLFDWADLGSPGSTGLYGTIPLRYNPGTEPSDACEVTSGATSMEAFIDRLGEQPGAFHGVTASGVGAAYVYRPSSDDLSAIAKRNLRVATDEYPGNLPPVFFQANGTAGDPTSIGYCRPLTASDQDVNGDENYQQAAIRVTLTTKGEVFGDLTITPSDTKVKVGDEVDFEVGGIPAGHDGLTYEWDFDDGATSTESAPAYTWDDEGPFDVGVVVKSTDGSYGRASVEVVVGEKKDGGDHPGGGGNGNDDNPDHGADTGPGGQAGNDPDGELDGLPGTDGDEGTGKHPGSEKSNTDGNGTPTQGDDENQPIGAGDGEISGILLTSATTSVPSSQDEAPTLSSPSVRPDADPKRDPLLYAAFAVPLLLLAGALAEYRLTVAAALSGGVRRLRRRKETTP